MKYNFGDINIENKTSLSIILSRVRAKSTILEFGCANGRMTKYLKEELFCRVYAVEIDEDAVRDASQYAEKIIIDDIENYSWKEEFDYIKFDYIIFADVLEHLYYPGKVLENVKEFLKEDGSILVSIPNIAHNSIVINLLKNRFDYNKTGLLDDTHVRFFTKDTFEEMVKKLGFFKSYSNATYAKPNETEFKNSYDEISFETAQFLKTQIYGEVYQFIYEFKKKKSPYIDDIPLGYTKYLKDYIQLFFEVDGTIDEKNSIKLSVNVDKLDKIQKFIFDLNGNRPIRLDPLNQSCEIEILKFSILKRSGEEIDIDYLGQILDNSYYKKDKNIYFLSDPQLLISGLDSDLYERGNQLVFYMKIKNIGIKALDKIIAYQINDLQQKNQEIQQKNQEIQQKNQEIQQKNQEIQQKNQEIQQKNQEIQQKNQEIVYWHNLAHSLRIVNRIKRIFKKLMPEKLWNTLRFIKHNPKFIQKSFYILKKEGFGVLFRKIDNKINKTTPVLTYSYVTPVLTEKIRDELKSFKKRPLVSITMPVYNVDPKWLDLAIKSCENQWYEAWELCIVDDKSTRKETLEYLQIINNNKIKVKFLKKNMNISGASNEALKLAIGEYIALMDHDDELTPDALYEVVKIINENGAEFIYSDEDKLNLDGSFCDPHFKPDFSQEMILSQNYMSHLGAIKKNLIVKVGGWQIGLEGAQDYDLYLKILEHTTKIYHIPKVLYHWRKVPGSTAVEFSEKSYAQDAGKKALQNMIKRKSLDADIENTPYPGIYKINYKIENNPLVSIVIPFKDMAKLLRVCVESILKKSTYTNFEIIGISNNSKEPETFKEMKRLENLDNRISFYEYNIPFNYSKINNYAVKKFAKGEQIILLNNDIEILSPNWIEEMLMHSQRKEIGCVGAKLYYPNDTIQHAGVIIGIGGVAGHSHKGFPKNYLGYFGRLQLIQNLSAVTAACLMVKRSIFDRVGGLNEKELKIAFNDVDFCLRVVENGYRNVFTPYCEAYHHESISRGTEDNTEKKARFDGEIKYMQKRHKSILQDGDPFYNPNLTLVKEDFSLR